MITDKIKALFQFIDYLHSNIENFKKYDEVINDLYLLDEKRSSLKPRNNFNDKLKHEEVQAIIKDKFKIIQENIIIPIRSRATVLNICNFQNEPLYSWNGVESDIHNLKENFSKEDIPEILQYKNKYIEFRTVTNCTYFQNFFFSGLDKILKKLFDFFKETEYNEFEAFEIKTIEVNSITELAEIISGKNKLNIEIDKNLSITEKLDYWKSVIDEYFNEPLTKQFGEYEFTFEQEQAKKRQLVKLFGTNYKLISPLLIPEQIYNEHFENGLNEPEFTYWFLQYNAQTYFDIEIKMKRLVEKLNTPLAESFINAELKRLTDFESKADILLNEGIIDIYKDYSCSEYAKEIEYLRIKADYYKTHAFPNVHTIGNTTVALYAEHIYLKEFLEAELKKPAPPPQPDKQKPELHKNELSEKIIKHFAFFQGICPRKHIQILKDEDFNKLIEWTIYFYENNFQVPEITAPISVVNTNKTYVQLAFKYLFKELHKASTYPKSLFDFYKSAFNPYSEDKKKNFEAVQNNDEVKKLMQIEY